MTAQSLLKIVLYTLLCIAILESCVHEPIRPTDLIPTDTTTTPVDTTGTNPDTTNNAAGNPCSPDTVYFQRDILPMLQSNCAKSGCHDEATAQNGVILTSYEKVTQTGDINIFNPTDSDIYEVLVDDDPDDRMPPSPNTPLSDDQAALILKWIQQGAQDLSCTDSSANSCDTISVSYSQTVSPILTNHCTGCHSGASASGGIQLNTHAGVAAVAQNGRLWGAISHQNGYSPMPQGGDQLPACELSQIKAWIDDGALDN